MKFSNRYLNVFAFLLIIQMIATQVSASAEPENESAFHNISLTTAKQMAEENGKNVFVEFYADWCVPCKWMEETTFSDPMVKQVLQEEYIAVRVDIDDFDGFALKEYYQIQVLPTILILDKNGRSLERKEQSLSADMLITLLDKNPVMAKVAPVNSSPRENTIQAEETTAKAELIEEKPDEHIINHATVKTNSYRVQVGVFTDYANTENLVGELREITDEPIVVLNDYLNNKTVFKVLLGDFEEKAKAELFKNELWQKYGIDGFVK